MFFALVRSAHFSSVLKIRLWHRQDNGNSGTACGAHHGFGFFHGESCRAPGQENRQRDCRLGECLRGVALLFPAAFSWFWPVRFSST